MTFEDWWGKVGIFLFRDNDVTKESIRQVFRAGYKERDDEITENMIKENNKKMDKKVKEITGIQNGLKEMMCGMLIASGRNIMDVVLVQQQYKEKIKWWFEFKEKFELKKDK